MHPTPAQLASVRRSGDRDVFKRFLTSTGLVVTQFNWGELEAIDRDGRLLLDTPVVPGDFPTASCV